MTNRSSSNAKPAVTITAWRKARKHPEHMNINTTFVDHMAAVFRPITLLKKRLWHRRFLVNFAKILRTSSLQNTSGRLFLQRVFWRLEDFSMSYYFCDYRDFKIGLLNEKFNSVSPNALNYSVSQCFICPFIRIEYVDLRSKSPYSVRIQENTDQKKIRSVCYLILFYITFINDRNTNTLKEFLCEQHHVPSLLYYIFYS